MKEAPISDMLIDKSDNIRNRWEYSRVRQQPQTLHSLNKTHHNTLLLAGENSHLLIPIIGSIFADKGGSHYKNEIH